MKLSTWRTRDGYQEATLTLDDGEPLLTLRKFKNGAGVVRGPTGVLLEEIEPNNLSRFNGNVDACLINSTKKILSGDFINIQQRLGLKTIIATKEFADKFMEEAHAYTDYGECDICGCFASRTDHETTNNEVIKVCSKCKLKIMFVEVGGR